MTDFSEARDPALGGGPTVDPATAAPKGRRKVMNSGNAWTLVAIVVAIAIGLAIWGWGGPVGEGTATHHATDGSAAPVYGGAAPTLAPAPSSSGNGSNH